MKGLSLRSFSALPVLAFLLLLLAVALATALLALLPQPTLLHEGQEQQAVSPLGGQPRATPPPPRTPTLSPVPTASPTLTPAPTSTPPPHTLVRWSFQPRGAVSLSQAAGPSFPAALDDALVLVLDGPASPEWVQRRWFMSPETPGEFAAVDARVVAFVPAEGWRPQTGYIFRIDGVNSYFLSFETRPWLTASPGPADVAPDAELRLGFHYPVDRAGLLAGLRIRPEVAFRPRWEAQTLVLAPAEEWALDTTYSVALDPAMPVPTWSFTTRPGVLSFSPPDRASGFGVITLTLDRPADRASVEAAFSVTPALTGTFGWQGEQVRFVPRGGLQLETTYEVCLGPSARAADGRAYLTRRRCWGFATQPGVLSFGPQDQASEYSVIALTLALPADRASVEAAFSVTPALAGTFDWQGEQMRFVPRDGLKLNTRYTACLEPSARAADGRAYLTQTRCWGFTTRSHGAEPSFGYGPNVQVLDAAGRRLVQVFSMDSWGAGPASWLDFSLYQASPEWLLSSYSSGFKGADAPNVEGLPLLKEWRAELQGSDVALPADLAPGLYILALSGLNGQHDSLLVVLTHYTLVLKESRVGVGSTARHQVAGYAAAISTAQPRPGLAVRIYDRSARLYGEGTTDDQGRFETTIPGDTDPLLALGEVDGEYTLCGFGPEWQQGGDIWWGWAPNPPAGRAFKAYLYSDRPIYRPGQTVYVKVVVRADDDAAYSLVPAGMTVTVRLRDARDNVLATRVLHTNEFGTVHTILDLAEGGTLGTYNLEAVVGSEVTRQELKVEEYRKPDYEVKVIPSRLDPAPGETITITVEAAYYFGRPVAGAPVTLQLYQQVYNWYDLGDWTSTAGWQKKGGAQSGRTNARGRWQARVQVPASADNAWWYGSGQLLSLEATVDDGSGQSVSGHTAVQVAGGRAEPFVSGGDSALKIAADRRTYAVGEEARLTVDTPVSGLGLLTLERGRVRRTQVVQLTAPQTTLALPIDPDFTPNIFVTIQVYQPANRGQAGRSSIPDAYLLLATTELIVPAADRQLQVTVAPERLVYAPRQEAAVVLEVRDAAGNPVRAELSLAMVDEAVYALCAELAPDPFAAFYGRRENLVRTFHALAPVRYLPCECGGGGGDDFSGDNPRQNFPDTAYWNPTIVSDENGRAVVTLPLPDSLTRWRLVARAVTQDTRVGEGTAALTVTQALVVQPALPRFLVQGDTLTLTAAVHNNGGAALTATAGLEAAGLAVAGPLTHTVALAAGETAGLAWTVEATTLGAVTVTTYAAAPGASDAVRYTIPVVPFAVPEVQSWSGEYVGERIERFYLPDGYIREATQLEVRLTPAIVPALLDGLEYLVGYPFG